MFRQIDALLRQLDSGSNPLDVAYEAMQLMDPPPPPTTFAHCLLRFNNRCSDQTCAICLEAFQTTDTVAMLACHHIFHPPCIERWAQLKRKCPLCKLAI